jgi:hypothetical protein
LSKHYREDKTCLNCGHTVQEYYCSHCGQENIDPHESFAHLVSHYIADYLHFDSKFFRTLGPLLFIPGKLTKEYVAGRRARYVHPFRLYIFITIIFYLVSSLFSRHEHEYVQVIDADSTRASVYLTDTLNSARMSLSFPEVRNYKSLEEYKHIQDSLPAEKKDGRVLRYVTTKIIPYGEQPNLFAKKVFDKFSKNLPKLMFVLLPLFALLVMLAYRRQHRFYTEHAIFSVHVHSFFFILLLLLVILHSFMSFDLGLVAAIVSVIYLFFALKRTYGRGKGITFLRLFTIIFLYGIVLVLCLLGNLALAIIML